MAFDAIRRYRLSRMIRKAIDLYPDGICFARLNGRVILTNQTMNSLCLSLTGHTVTNGADLWRELEDISRGKESGDDAGEDSQSNSREGQTFSAGPEREQACQEITHTFPDGRKWRFRRSILRMDGELVAQYEATDVTELTELQEQLRESNLRTEKMHRRQQELLKNIVQNNLDQELLSAKMHIHDEFGRLLILTKNAAQQPMKAGELQALRDSWLNAAANMENAAWTPDADQSSPREELVRTAGMIGCGIEFYGEEPKEREALLLLYAALREALTNAIRHGKANLLRVTIAEEKTAYAAAITDNGSGGRFPIQEGGGLKALRQRLEKEGASLEYEYPGGLTMKLRIPKA